MRKCCACDTKNAHKKPDGANHPVLLFGIGKNVQKLAQIVCDGGAFGNAHDAIAERVQMEPAASEGFG